MLIGKDEKVSIDFDGVLVQNFGTFQANFVCFINIPILEV